MMNNVGGSVIHYGAWLRRFHPHHLKFRSHIIERWGEKAIPEGCTSPIGRSRTTISNPTSPDSTRKSASPATTLIRFSIASSGYPLPPTRPFRLGQTFTEATRKAGLHPHAVPVGYNTAPYNGFQAATYTAWDNGFGSWSGSKWHPGLTSVPKALATGNFDLRTECRVTRVLTNNDGRAIGVEYIDRDGRPHTQLADQVVLCSYTWENVRLMFLSADAKHPDGLGNNAGQLGKHLMIKMFAHVGGYFPDQVFNRHTGPAAQGVVLDDFLEPGFDSVEAGGFLGGLTLARKISSCRCKSRAKAVRRPSLPGAPNTGTGSSSGNISALSGPSPRRFPINATTSTSTRIAGTKAVLGMPVVRVTYDLQPNERRIGAYFHDKAAEILRAMGASETWNGPDFTGIGSSHDLGGTRMADDPAAGVVDRNLAVHDTPGLFVFGGSAMPTCPGINPTLTLWAMVYRAAEALIEARGGTMSG